MNAYRGKGSKVSHTFFDAWNRFPEDITNTIHSEKESHTGQPPPQRNETTLNT